jgi:tRNA(Arg) A34 adenosine deaminase TadA
MGEAREAWAALEEPWRICLELAWEAFGAGTVPVGAVVADGAGRVVARGRNRIFEAHGPPDELANTRLAHAELNALRRLSPARHYRDHVLYSALEPCHMCLGAVPMSRVGRLRYAGADPYGGAVGRQDPTFDTELNPVEIEGPRADAFGRLATALLPAAFLRLKAEGSVVAIFRERHPDHLARAEALLERGAAETAASGAPLAEALGAFFDVLG